MVMICGKQLGRINNNHLKLHNMKMAEYRERFPSADIVGEKIKNKISNSLAAYFKNSDHREIISRNMKKAWVDGKFTALIGKEASVETRRKMSESHKGKKMSLDNKEKLRQRMMGNTFGVGKNTQPKTEEFKRNLSIKMQGNKSMLGISRPPEVCAKHAATAKKMWSEGKLGHWTDDLKKQRSEITKMMWQKGILKHHWHPKWEDELEQWLESKNIKFQRQYRISSKQFDFYLTDYNLLIELDGCFWHGCDQCYPEEKYKCEPVLRNIKNDKFKTDIALLNGFQLLRIWEHEDMFGKIRFALHEQIGSCQGFY